MASALLAAPPGARVPGGDPLAYLARKARNRRDNAEAQFDYGTAMLNAGRHAEALEHLRRAVDLAPLNAACHVNLAAAYQETGQFGPGIWHAQRGYELDPTQVISALNVGAFHYWLGEIPDAIRWLEKAIAIDPSCWKAWWMWLFMLDFTSISPEDALAARRKFAAQFEAPLKPSWPQHENDPDPDRRIRIGLTGGDFRQHSSSYMWGPLFEMLNRERYQIISYAHLTLPDALTEWFKRGSNGWRDITHWPDDRLVAEQVRRDGIDVLIDLGTFSDNSHLMTHLYKPAPVSLTAWGHLTGTGLDCMDGLLVDRVMVPEGREWEMTERPAYVPYAMGWYRPKDDLPILPRPERPLTFGYLGRVQKLDNPTVSLWADLLLAHPGSRLVLKDQAYYHERTRLRTVERFEAWGIDPARLDVRGPSDRSTHMATYRDVDVALDPLSQGGGATTLEALMMGVPTVTLRGERLVRRVSASTVTAAGHPEWVAEDIHQYVEIAGRIAADGGQRLRDEFYTSHICDGAARTRAFEDAVRGFWRRWCGERRGA